MSAGRDETDPGTRGAAGHERPDARTGTGRRGEEIARRHLESLGYRILDIRWRCKVGEIDIVARDPSCGSTVFVEVRTRSALTHGRPEETVDRRKQRRIARLAAAWLATRGDAGARACRFDVIAVRSGPEGGPSEIVHFRDAFDSPSP